LICKHLLCLATCKVLESEFLTKNGSLPLDVAKNQV
jgi:hypothetical protein